MKKLLTVLLVVVALATTTAAQDLINFDNITYGLTGGVNYTNVAKQFDSKIGFELGGYANYALDQDLSIKTSLLYATCGSKNGDSTLKLAYVKVPVVVAYKVTPEIKCYGGVYGAYKLSADVDNDGTNVDVKDSYKTLDYGVLVGGSYTIDQFVIDASYTLGLVNITGNDAMSYQNSGIAVGVGYNLDI
jgi:hypothetical protein